MIHIYIDERDDEYTYYSFKLNCDPYLHLVGIVDTEEIALKVLPTLELDREFSKSDYSLQVILKGKPQPKLDEYFDMAMNMILARDFPNYQLMKASQTSFNTTTLLYLVG